MKRAGFFALFLLLMLTASCRKEAPTDAGNPWPVWIVDLFVYKASSDPDNPNPPIVGNPVGVFHIWPGNIDTVVSTVRGQPSRIHLWQSIDSVVHIEYYVRCTNYSESEARTITLYESAAFQGPGRAGGRGDLQGHRTSRAYHGQRYALRQGYALHQRSIGDGAAGLRPAPTIQGGQRGNTARSPKGSTL